MRAGTFDLRSGRWQGELEASSGGTVLELCHLVNGRNKMRLRLPENWRALSNEQLEQLARRPEVRLWVDDQKLLWRISAVGPGTDFPYPLRSRHLVFDSDRAWAGIVAFRGPEELGDLTDLELQRLRDGISDFGGRRRAYRPPLHVT